MRKENRSLMTLVVTALLTAITLVCTMFIKIPIGVGYIHLGDAIVLLSVIILPRKHACFAGPVGATLADIAGGFAAWAPWTLVIQLLIVIVFGLCIDSAKSHKKAKIFGLPSMELVGYILASVTCILGYYVAEAIMYGNWIAAAAGIPFNIIQMLVGAVVAVLVSNALNHTSINESMNYRR